MSRTTRNMTMTETLRQAIENSGLPYLTIEQRTGVLRQTVMRFMKGRDIQLASADKLAALLGIRITLSETNRRCSRPQGTQRRKETHYVNYRHVSKPGLRSHHTGER